MEDKEIEEIMSGEKELYMSDVFRLMVKLNSDLTKVDSKVKQLYQQTYNPPTNNDLHKSINDLSERMNSIESRLREALK